MLELINSHLLLIATALLLVDIAAWRLLPADAKLWRVVLRVVFFLTYSLVIVEAGLSPLLPPPWPTPALNMLGSVLGIAWWLLLARTATVVMGVVLMPRSGHTGRLLQDVLGAMIFLLAAVAAAAYVMQLPVKGLLATSGVVAIVVGLALQSTLSDVFSGIVLNTTKPYRLDDWISIDGVEGQVVEIDWRATYLKTAQGSTVVIPNSVAAKTKVVNFNRAANVQGVSISISVPAAVRPRVVIEALEKTLQGVSALLPKPPGKVSIKGSDLEAVEYEASGFIATGQNSAEARNLMFDLAHRLLEAAGVQRSGEAPRSRMRSVLDDVKIFRSLSSEQKDELSQNMQAQRYVAGQVVLEFEEVAEHLMVIGTGVVSASVHNAEGDFVEAGRMGPGEILGEEGIAHGVASHGRFTTLSSAVIYLIDKEHIQHCLQESTEVSSALTKLHAFRTTASESLLLQKPAEVKKGKFLSWLQRT
ncbi:mechanosensitive ion channel family protein [Pseudomonas sp. GV071]|jgi:small-conductance mechanosensitive channel/CRP-like cAMP-binding protein|uniref:mechanosensitive ion channel family protein n=1 Tax=Pseudomonas sp. GV071 TaxID=2135754 RepID=UPI000D3430EA|nr:mechanosensitive ion channel family protein [Pseudomonas sp. GV071]PTQ68216.1 cyclic nucleotide-binding protein [Pseudomonas sp. GV071]